MALQNPPKRSPRFLISPQRGLTPLSRRLPLPLTGPFCSLDASKAPLPYPHLRSHFLLLLLRWVLSTRPSPRSLPRPSASARLLCIPLALPYRLAPTSSVCVSCVRRGSGSTQPSLQPSEHLHDRSALPQALPASVPGSSAAVVSGSPGAQASVDPFCLAFCVCFRES